MMDRGVGLLSRSPRFLILRSAVYEKARIAVAATQQIQFMIGRLTEGRLLLREET